MRKIVIVSFSLLGNFVIYGVGVFAEKNPIVLFSRNNHIGSLRNTAIQNKLGAVIGVLARMALNASEFHVVYAVQLLAPLALARPPRLKGVARSDLLRISCSTGSAPSIAGSRSLVEVLN